MKRNIISLCFFLGLCSAVFATFQRPEIIFFKGEVYDVHSGTLPLESYFEAGNPKPEGGFGRFLSTGLYRGYIGKWRVIDGKLYLEAITRPFIYEEEGKMYEVLIVLPSSIVFGKDSRYPILADWYSGTLQLTPPWNQKSDDHQFEKGLLTFEKGELMKIAENEGFDPFTSPSARK